MDFPTGRNVKKMLSNVSLKVIIDINLAISLSLAYDTLAWNGTRASDQ